MGQAFQPACSKIPIMAGWKACHTKIARELNGFAGGVMFCKWNCWLFGPFIGIILISLLQLTITCEAQTPGASEPLGQMRRIQGPAIVQRADSPEFQPLAEQNPTSLNDMIGTDPAPEARIWWKGSQAVQADSVPGDSFYFAVSRVPDASAGHPNSQLNWGRGLGGSSNGYRKLLLHHRSRF